MKHLLSLLLALFCIPSISYSQTQYPSNIIFVILDDVGYDTYKQVNTPNIDLLAANGIEYTRAYSHPWCKPSRDSLLFGTHIGVARSDSCAPVDSTSISGRTFVSDLHDAGMITTVVGKWHIGRAASTGLPWWYAPHSVGFDNWLAGVSTGNPTNPCNLGSAKYQDNGVFYSSGKHELELQRDAALSVEGFIWLAFTDAHKPWELPPSNLLPSTFQISLNPTDQELYEAEVVAIDFVIGQLIAGKPSDTWWIIMSENGTPQEVGGGKKTLYENGVRVPLIIAGPGLIPQKVHTPVHLYDIPQTLMDSLGIAYNSEGRNITSLVPNEHVHVNSSVGQAVVEKDFKLIRNADGSLEFYCLPDETNQLPLMGPDFDRLFNKLK